MTTKIDLKIEAARMAMEKDIADFDKNARTIYAFLVEGLDIPDNEPGMDSVIQGFQSLFPPQSNKKDENSAAKPMEA